MGYEETKHKLGDKPNFGLVVLMAATAILAILIAAAMIIILRGKQAKKVPYTKQPTALLAAPPATRRLG